MGAVIGKDCLILPRVDILIPWHLKLGDCVVLSHDVRILNFTDVTIHSMTVISQYVYLCTGTHDYTHPHFPLTFASIEVGQESWLASGVFIAPGVSIGNGCVIGANSVVTQDTPEWMVCAGNPCRPLKGREVTPLQD